MLCLNHAFLIRWYAVAKSSWSWDVYVLVRVNLWSKSNISSPNAFLFIFYYDHFQSVVIWLGFLYLHMLFILSATRNKPIYYSFLYLFFNSVAWVQLGWCNTIMATKCRLKKFSSWLRQYANTNTRECREPLLLWLIGGSMPIWSDRNWAKKLLISIRTTNSTLNNQLLCTSMPGVRYINF